MGQPEQIKGDSKWYLMDSHGYMVVRVRPRMPLGETPSGAVSFDPSHAQLELQISDDGGVILQAAGTHELVTPSGESRRSAPLPVYRRVDIRLPNNVLHLDTDFSDLESAGEPLDIRAVEQGPTHQTDVPEETMSGTPVSETPMPKSPAPEPPEPRPKQESSEKPIAFTDRKAAAGKPGSDPATGGRPISPKRRSFSKQLVPTSRADQAIAAPAASSVPERAQPRDQQVRRADKPPARPETSRPESETNLDRRPLPEPVKAAILITAAASIILLFMIMGRDWTPASRVQPETAARTPVIPEPQVVERSADESPSTPTNAAEAEDISSVTVAPEPQPLPDTTDDVPVESNPEGSPPDSSSGIAEAPSGETRYSPPPAQTTPDAEKPAGQIAAADRTIRPAEPAAPEADAPDPDARALDKPAVDPVRILATADLALAQGRLVTPAEASAFTLYSKVLDIEPDSVEAAEGIKAIQQGLINQALAQLARNELLEAESTLASANMTGANPSLVADLQAEVEFRQKLAAAQTGQFDTIIPVDQLVARQQVAPRWPRNANGTVAVLFTVTETGDVTDIDVINDPPRKLERAALRAISDWQFEPYLYNGRPLPVRSSVNFTLGN